MFSAEAKTSWPASRPAIPRARAAAYARVEVLDNFDDAHGAWTEIAARAGASAYQSLAFARAWSETFKTYERVKPMIVVARGEADEVVALLPLGQRLRGAVRIASFLGGRFANYQMGWFLPGHAWSREDVSRLLREAARAARPRVDAFHFIYQPLFWDGAGNPLATLPSRPSPSNAYASELPAQFETWFGAHFSKSTQKKLRKKAKKYETLGQMNHVRANDRETARKFLDAFFAQRRATTALRRQYNEFEEPKNIELMERLAGLRDAPASMEMHALRAGERIVAVFGGIASANRLSGVIIAHDPTPLVASSSPGEWLVIEVVRDAIERGMTMFDLGVGDARYKKECCEIVEPMFDGAFSVTWLGRLSTPLFLAARNMKKRVKTSPRGMSIINQIRAWLGR